MEEQLTPGNITLGFVLYGITREALKLVGDMVRVKMNGKASPPSPQNLLDHDLLIEINVRTERLEQDVAEIKHAVAQRDD